MSFPKTRPTDELIIMPVDDELLIYDQTQDKGHSLNPTAAFVFQHCDGKTAPTDLAAKLENQFNVDHGEELVNMTLARLQKANLLQGAVHVSKTISRRDMLSLASRAGMAAALLPIISSIAAPTPAHAMSGGPTSNNCRGVHNTNYPISAVAGTKKKAKKKAKQKAVQYGIDFCRPKDCSGSRYCDCKDFKLAGKFQCQEVMIGNKWKWECSNVVTQVECGCFR